MPTTCSTPHPDPIKGLFVGGAIGLGVGAFLAVTGLVVILDAQHKMNSKPDEGWR